MERFRTFFLVLWSVVLLVGAGIFAVLTMPAHPGANSVLQVGQSTLFFSSQSDGDYDIDMSKGHMEASGNIGEGYVLYAYQSTNDFLHVQLYHNDEESEFGIAPEDGMCFIHIERANLYFSFIVKDGIGLIYRGQSSITPCVEGKE